MEKRLGFINKWADAAAKASWEKKYPGLNYYDYYPKKEALQQRSDNVQNTIFSRDFPGENNFEFL